MSQGLPSALQSSKMLMIQFTTALDVWLDGRCVQVEQVSYSSELRFSMWIASEMYGFASAFVRTDMTNAFCSNSSAFSTTTAVQNHAWSTFCKLKIFNVLFPNRKAIPLFLTSTNFLPIPQNLCKQQPVTYKFCTRVGHIKLQAADITKQIHFPVIIIT